MLHDNIPAIRLTSLDSGEIRPQGDFVLYWMVSSRRVTWSYALDRAIAWAQHLAKPLLILEPLRAGYPWASDRLHSFVIDGMESNARALASKAVSYYAYVEPEPGEGRGLLEALAARACVVVTDDYPEFFLPRMLGAAADKIDVRLEAVDGNGLLPLGAAPKAFSRAVDLRRFLQKTLAPYLLEAPAADPLEGVELPTLPALPPSITERWPDLSTGLRAGDRPDLATLAIDHSVGTVEIRGGSEVARSVLDRFLGHRLARYTEGRLDLDNPSTSGLSPYLHFGHISCHQIFRAVADHESWNPGRLSSGPHRGQRQGWWGMSPVAESFLDELVTWRELGFNAARHLPDHHSYDSLPVWARTTLGEHRDDPREQVYELEEFEAAQTHDEIWNAAQRELLLTGTLHNYLRMLWGKKILEWTLDPRDALAVMVELNNKYALDGRDPNSYSGIFWVLGRFDRAWGPERPIFGKIRYMSSDSTRRKVRMGSYLERFGSQMTLGL